MRHEDQQGQTSYSPERNQGVVAKVVPYSDSPVAVGGRPEYVNLIGKIGLVGTAITIAAAEG